MSPSKLLRRGSHSPSFIGTNCPSKCYSKAYCIGMMWNIDDVMSLTRNGMPFAETLPTNDINALVFCTESTTILPYSNGYIK